MKLPDFISQERLDNLRRISRANALRDHATFLETRAQTLAALADACGRHARSLETVERACAERAQAPRALEPGFPSCLQAFVDHATARDARERAFALYARALAQAVEAERESEEATAKLRELDRMR